MSKAIEGAAMLAGAVGIGALLFFDPMLAFTPGLIQGMYALAAGGLAMEAGAVADALTAQRGQNITTRMAAGLRQIVYGMQRIGGVVVYQSTTGAGGSPGNYVYNYVIPVAGHEIDAFINLYLDGRQVYWKQNGNAANIGCGAVSDPPVCTVSVASGAVTGITAMGGSGFANINPTRYRVRIWGGGGSGATAWAALSGSTWTVTMATGGTGYTSTPNAEIQGAYTFGGTGAADQQDPTQPGYGLGYGIGPDGRHYNFSNLVFAEVRFGDQLPGDIMESLSANDPNWAAQTGSSQATGTAYINPMLGHVVAVAVDTGLYLYSAPPEISFSGGGGSGVVAHGVITDGQLSVVIDDPGSGYTAAPTVDFTGGTLVTGAGNGPRTPYGGGCAYIYLNVGYNTDQFPAAPEIRLTINGKNNIYDPRTAQTGFSSNWALCVADVLTDPVWGLGDTGSVNTDQLIAAANVCDEWVMTSQGEERNYALNLHYDSSTAPGDALQLMMPAAAGRLSRIGGQWFIWPAYWQGPSFNFDQSALVGTPSWAPTRSFKDLINRVNGTYIAPNYPYNCAGNLYDKNGWYYGTIDDVWPFAWQPTNFPQYAADALHGYAADQFLVEDGGVLLPKELTLRGVISIVQAQRVAKILLMRNRQQGTGSFPMQLAAWQMQPADVMQFSWPALGWENKVLEIDSVHFACEEQGSEEGQSGGDGPKPMQISTMVQVIETDASVYEWSETEELTPYVIPAAPSQMPYTPAPPTGLTLSSSAGTAVVGADGVTIPRVLVSWTAPADITVVSVDVQYRLHGAASWIDTGPVDVALFETYVGSVVSGQVYDFRACSLRSSGSASTWVEVDSYAVSTVLSSISASAISGLTTAAMAQLGAMTVLGTGSATAAPGSAAQVGTGATVSIVGSGSDGTLTLTTGSGTLAAGVIAVVNFPSTLSAAPNGVCAPNGSSIPGLSWAASTTQLALSVSTALAPSATYEIGYSLG